MARTPFGNEVVLDKDVAGTPYYNVTVPDMTAVSATIDTPGSAYLEGDVLSVVGGTYSTQAKFTSGAVEAGGLDSVTVHTAGEYSVLPTNPVSLTGGSGSNGKLAVTWDLLEMNTAAYVESGTATIIPASQAKFLPACRAATTPGGGNITLASTGNGATVDGIVLATGDRLLVKDQTSPPENGTYVVGASACTRATDWDSSSDFGAPVIVPVQAGTVNANTRWRFTPTAVVTVGSTAVSMTQDTGF